MTPVDQERLAKIQANADHALDVLSEARGAPVDYDADSIAWVEGFIERARERYAPEPAPEGLIATIGCYLGEAIIAETGGGWADDDALGGPGVAFLNGDIVFPLTKVTKQFAEGVAAGESILSFYTVAVSYVAIGGLHAPEEPAS